MAYFAVLSVFQLLVLGVVIGSFFLGDGAARDYVVEQVDAGFRWGMGWFIFSEVMFFGAFFGALFYMRVLTVPETNVGFLSGGGARTATPHYLNYRKVSIYGGSNEVQRTIIAGSILGL